MLFQEGMKLYSLYHFDVANKNHSSPTMARCAAAKEANNAETDFLAPGYSRDSPLGRVAYGP
jgi:hypothetical protein